MPDGASKHVSPQGLTSDPRDWRPERPPNGVIPFDGNEARGRWREECRAGSEAIIPGWGSEHVPRTGHVPRASVSARRGCAGEGAEMLVPS